MGRQFIALDEDVGIFFEGELEQIKARSYDKLYPELMARTLFPLDTTTDTGANTVGYDTWDHVGLAKLIHTYAMDLPNIEVTAKQTIRKIYGEGVSFTYSIQDIRAARYAGKPLDQKKANAARRQMLQLENDLAFRGDEATDIPGFISAPNINVVAPVVGAGGQTTWASKTPDEIISDVSRMVSMIRDTSNGVESPNTLLIPEAQYTQLSNLPRSSLSDTTILDFIERSNRWVQSIIAVYELKDSVPADPAYDGQDCAILYDRSPDKLWLEVPQDVEMFPVQERGLMYETNVHARTAGVIIAYPKSVAQLNGI